MNIILLLLIIILIYLLISNNRIIILNDNELLDVILSDFDNYYKTFSSLDLKVRKVNSIEEYKNKIKNSPTNINLFLKNKLINVINKIDNIFDNYKVIGFDGKKANKIKWKIGIVKDKNYENGYPHTRNDVIIIPYESLFSKHLMSTLIHEKVHIYQKTYPEDIEKYLNHHNFIKINNIHKNIRANPDTNNFIYKNSRNQPLLCLYNENPENLMDCTFYPIDHQKYEHPFEYMAYTIQYDIT
jgi:hypothetical protein